MDIVERLKERAGAARCEGNMTARCDADYFEEAAALIASQAARIRELEEAAEQARLFIASEYQDPAMEERGEWLPPDARKVHNALAGLLSRKGGE